jgi:hypothetical protein
LPFNVITKSNRETATELPCASLLKSSPCAIGCQETKRQVRQPDEQMIGLNVVQSEYRELPVYCSIPTSHSFFVRVSAACDIKSQPNFCTACLIRSSLRAKLEFCSLLDVGYHHLFQCAGGRLARPSRNELTLLSLQLQEQDRATKAGRWRQRMNCDSMFRSETRDGTREYTALKQVHGREHLQLGGDRLQLSLRQGRRAQRRRCFQLEARGRETLSICGLRVDFRPKVHGHAPR